MKGSLNTDTTRNPADDYVKNDVVINTTCQKGYGDFIRKYSLFLFSGNMQKNVSATYTYNSATYI